MAKSARIFKSMTNKNNSDEDGKFNLKVPGSVQKLGIQLIKRKDEIK